MQPCTRGGGGTARRTAAQVVVDESHRLHERVHGGRPDEPEAAGLEITGERARFHGRGRDRGATPGRGSGGWREAPHVRGEGAQLLLDREHLACIHDRRLDLAAVSDDARVSEKTAHVPRAVARHTSGIEARERDAEAWSLAKDREPRQPRLESFEGELLVETAVVDDRQSPFGVMVRAIARVGIRPPASSAITHARPLV